MGLGEHAVDLDMGFRAFRTASIPSSFAPSIRIRPPGTTAPMASATADRCGPWISRSAQRGVESVFVAQFGTHGKAPRGKPVVVGAEPLHHQDRFRPSAPDPHHPAPSAHEATALNGGERALCRARGSICRGHGCGTARATAFSPLSPSCIAAGAGCAARNPSPAPPWFPRSRRRTRRRPPHPSCARSA
jgi:hypothetical protein